MTSRVVAAVALALACGLAPAAQVKSVPPVDLEGLPEGWYAQIETSEGTIVAILHPEQAPQSVAHFVSFAEGTQAWTDTTTGEVQQRPYYDGAEVHKAVAGNRFEVGEPVGSIGQPPQVWVRREFPRKLDFSVPYRLGLTAEANNKVSAVVFFVSVAPLPYLNNQHPCIGSIVRGKEVARRITEVRTYSNDRPVEAPKIYAIRIHRHGDPPPLEEPKKHRPRPDRLRIRKS